MTNRLLYLTQYVLSQVWLFMKIPFPGTDIPVGALLVFPTVVGFAVRFLRNMFGVGGVGDIPSVAKSQFYNDYRKFESQSNYGPSHFMRKW